MSQHYESAIVDSIDQIDAGQWNELCPDDQPFISHAFLSALERFSCATPETGWTARHLILKTADEQIIAAMPLYLKNHSWGEFVFDFGWAEAYARSGRHYYPKLVCMTPFTPVTGQRLLCHRDHGNAAPALLQKAIELVDAESASSLHILYPRASEMPLFEQASLLPRQDVRFLWSNDGFKTFDDFLATFSAAKRKKVRRERRRITEQNIVVSTIPAAQLSKEQWQDIYELCAATFYRRGHRPYLGLDFFLHMSSEPGNHCLVNVARIDERIVGAAILFRDKTTLYGRYWGGLPGLDCLHFETCYYRGIEYCIEQQLRFFDPGTQGEHKLSRGFAPVTTWSAHWLADAQCQSAVASFLEVEREQVIAYTHDLRCHLPFKQQS